MTFEDWIERANKLLVDLCGITFSDVGAEESDLRRHWSDGDSPEEFVSWYAEKYDLALESGVTLEGVVAPNLSAGGASDDPVSLLRECLTALNTVRAFSYQYATERRGSYDLAARIEKAFRRMDIDPYRMPEV